MADELPDPNVVEGLPHPRESTRLVGHADAEAALLALIRDGRLPHACLFGGRLGIGKATLAWRVAKFLLASGDPRLRAQRAERGLAVDDNDPAVRRVLASSHPDLFVLRRGPTKDGKSLAQQIAVERARQAVSFLAGAAAEGGWRVVVLDAADDLNIASANALLKTIEEAPARTAILIVAHRPGLVLPTIRSRCRRFALAPLAPADTLRVATEVAGRAGLPADAVHLAAACAAADGAPGAALRVLAAEGGAFATRVERLLAGLPAFEPEAALALAEACAKRDNDDAYRLLLDAVETRAAREVAERAGEGARRLAPLAALWNKARDAARTTDAFNLDRRATALTLLAELAHAAGASRRDKPSREKPSNEAGEPHRRPETTSP